MTEETNDFKKMSDVLGEIISQKHIRVGIDKIRIQEAWRIVMGKNIEKYTSNVSYKKGVLSVKLKSSVLKEELFFEKEKVKRLLNENLGKKYIKEIKLNWKFQFYQSEMKSQHSHSRHYLSHGQHFLPLI